LLGSKQWAYISGVTSTLQLHVVPVAGIYLSISLLSGCAAAGAVRYIKELLRYPWFWMASLLFAFQSVSLLWAYSHRAGARVLVYQLPFIFLSLAMVHLAREDRVSATRLLKIVLAFTVLQSAAVIVFRLFPAIKLAYLNSVLANLFESSNRLAAYASADPSMSVLDSSKSAGITTYPNPAAAWLGLAAMSTWYFSRFCKSRWLAYVAALNFIAVFFTGSKAGIITACLMFALMSLLEVIQDIAQKRRLDLRYAIAACLILSLVIVATPFAAEHLERGVADSSATLSTRQELWSFAQYEFRVHPIEGLGFGGWEAQVPIQGRTPHMPPHNAFIILWAQSGLLAALLGLCFAVTFLWWAMERIARGSASERLIAKGLFAGYLWMFVQAQGENFGVFGEDHMKPIIALMAGFLAGIRVRPSAPVQQPVLASLNGGVTAS
jgi:O-antigen ligase